MLGLGHSFIKFPKTAQPIKLSKERDADRGPVESRTSDGLEVILDISFQYSLISTQLYDLYMAYKENYKSVIIASAFDVINDKATSYTAYNFFVKRGEISVSMEGALREALSECCYVTVNSFQLADVDLPDPFENSISESEVKNQDIKKAEAEYDQSKIELDTRVQKAEANKKVMMNKALGDAKSLLVKTQGQIGGFELTEKALIEGYTNIKDSNQQTSNDFLAFLRAKLIDEYKGKSITVGLDPIKHKKPAKPSEPVDPIKPVDPAKPVDPIKPEDPVKPADNNQP